MRNGEASQYRFRVIFDWANRRAELYLNLKTALEGRLQLPDSDGLHGDLTSTGCRYDSSVRLLLESKDDVRKRLGGSPDDNGNEIAD